MDPRKSIFDAVRAVKGDISPGDVLILDEALDRVDVPRATSAPRRVGTKGIALMHKWEGCAKRRPDGRFEAYPDPGSKDGRPWTIGWGSTGPDIGRGTIWTKAECDARFERDLVRYANEVSGFLADAPTTQDQFDALVAFHYNTGAIGKSTLGKLHKAGNYAGAAAEFGKWIYNDGKPLEGLKKRRADEAELYRSAS
ncbi:lysozyme [Novosphingobium soli]|uniref:Lysozyme n=1 Tax=Novosphingobium soli TaxID=574956 RepID=A0ABV6CWB8_9SPHN